MKRTRARKARHWWSGLWSWARDCALFIVVVLIILLLLAYAFTARKAAAQPWPPYAPHWHAGTDVKMGGGG